MMKYTALFLMGTALVGCEATSTVMSAYQEQQQQQETTTQGVVTRASVEASDLSVVRAAPSVDDLKFSADDYYIALSNNNSAVNYGNEGEAYLTLRGGLVISQYFMGNDLLGVKQNTNDPVQFWRPYAEWPSSYTRTYQLPGDGIEGELVNVTCTHQVEGTGVTEILEVAHNTALITETCTGDAKIENTYMIDASGYIWRSEQWAGNNPYPIYLDIVEPIT